MNKVSAVATAESRGLRSIWYMGAKSRVLPGFLDEVLKEEVPPGRTIVDLMSGSGVVAAFCADRWRVVSNDAQAYAKIIAQSLIEQDPGDKPAFLASIRWRQDLGAAYESNFAALAAMFAPALEREDEFLQRFLSGDEESDWCAQYRRYLTEPGGLHGDSGAGVSPPPAAIFARAQKLLSDRSIAAYRQEPSLRPACLVTAYYGNVYFGLRQAMTIDSLRAAIDDLPGGNKLAELRRIHYLSALLHAASHSTSGTSHFAQPRHLTKDSELRAMAKRRSVDIWERCEDFSTSIAETVRATRHLPGNQALLGDYRRFITRKLTRSAFEFPGEVDLVYLDPPYTADHYSRFYHVLEVIARYDYPHLETDARGRVVRGRYPVIADRFQSDFCRRATVEDEFRRVIAATAGAGAKLIISYAAPTGLLIKHYARCFPGVDPVARLEHLCAESYGAVETRRRQLTHSGQGEAGRAIDELLVICREPRAD